MFSLTVMDSEGLTSRDKVSIIAKSGIDIVYNLVAWKYIFYNIIAWKYIFYNIVAWKYIFYDIMMIYDIVTGKYNVYSL